MCSHQINGSVKQCHLLDLNDDCLLSIAEHLQWIDLCSLARTCTRLNGIARLALTTQRNTSLLINRRHSYQTNRSGEHRWTIGKCTLIKIIRPIKLVTLQQNRCSIDELIIQQYLQHFGDLLYDINFDYQFWVMYTSTTDFNIGYQVFANERLFECLLRRCRGGALRRLRIVQINWTRKLARLAWPVLQQLTALRMVNCENVPRILRACGQCAELCVEGPISCDMLRFQFPNLRKMSLVDQRLGHGLMPIDTCEPNCKCYEQFLLRHRRLCKLELNIPVGFDLMMLGQLDELIELQLRGSLFALNRVDQQVVAATRTLAGRKLIGRVENGMNILKTSFRRIRQKLRPTLRIVRTPSTEFNIGHLKKLHLDGEMRGANEFVVTLIECNDNSLEELHIGNGSLSAQTISALNRLKRLQKLELILIRYSPRDAFKFFKNVHQLIELKLHFNAEHTMRMSDISSDHWAVMPKLHLKNAIIDLQFLQILRRLPLQELHLSQIQLMDIGDEEMVCLLRHFAQLRLLRLADCEPPVIRKCLLHLDAIGNLHRIILESCCIDGTLIDGLVRFNALHTLEMYDAHAVDIVNSGSERAENLQRLKSVNTLILHNMPSEIGENFLAHLGSAGTLQHLTIGLCNESTDFTTIVRRFNRLRTLTIDEMEIVTDADIDHIDQPELEELSMLYGAYGDYGWAAILKMISRLTKLRKLKLRNFYRRNVLDINMHGELLQICKSRRLKLFVELQQLETIDLPSYFHADDNCSYLEIRFVDRGCRNHSQ